uniref:Secreted protein n=1 Tax=Haemonchus contortus TaxID=6289 RepID=A0A7I5EAJ4_HAECO|nr:unnamed protein product [Haemonchus contortus]
MFYRVLCLLIILHATSARLLRARVAPRAVGPVVKRGNAYGDEAVTPAMSPSFVQEPVEEQTVATVVQAPVQEPAVEQSGYRKKRYTFKLLPKQLPKAQ